jgi:hypothetical protein
VRLGQEKTVLRIIDADNSNCDMRITRQAKKPESAPKQ